MTVLPNTTVSLSRDPRSKTLIVSLDGGPLGVRVSMSPKKDSPGLRQLEDVLLWRQIHDFAASTVKPLQAARRLWEVHGIQRLSGDCINVGLITNDNDYEADLLPMTYYLRIDGEQRTLKLVQANPESAPVSIGRRYQEQLINEVKKRVSEVESYRLDLPHEPSGGIEHLGTTQLTKVRKLDEGDWVLLHARGILEQISSPGSNFIRLLDRDGFAPVQVQSITAIGQDQLRVVYRFIIEDPNGFGEDEGFIFARNLAFEADAVSVPAPDRD